MTEFILRYWIVVVFGGIVAILTWNINFIKKHIILYFERKDDKIDKIAEDMEIVKEELRQQKKTDMLILRDRLNQILRYYLEKGYCSMDERDNIAKMYEQYQLRGGNGAMQEFMDRLCSLPFGPPTD